MHQQYNSRPLFLTRSAAAAGSWHDTNQYLAASNLLDRNQYLASAASILNVPDRYLATSAGDWHDHDQYLTAAE